jgi:hypothetical protein
MTACTSGTEIQILPNAGKKLVFILGTSVNNTDYFTLDNGEFSVVEGACLRASDGTIAAITRATNVITFSNGSTKTWSGFAWGY